LIAVCLNPLQKHLGYCSLCSDTFINYHHQTNKRKNMKKIIKTIRPVADSYNPHLPLELTIHKTSYMLTDLFLGEWQPFRKEMEKKFFLGRH